MRTTALSCLVLAAGCGTVCDSAIAAERGANSKALDCNLSNITVHDNAKCNSGLAKCNSDDLKVLDNYATCLNQLPVCNSSNQTSFNLSRLGCTLQPFGTLSSTCAGAIL